jgi:hypothetical protein
MVTLNRGAVALSSRLNVAQSPQVVAWSRTISNIGEPAKFFRQLANHGLNFFENGDRHDLFCD